jgi:hypothetical protein
MVRYGEGRRRFTKKHPAALTLNQLIPAGFVVGGVAYIVISVFAVLFKLLLVPTVVISLCYCLYIVILLVESMRITFRGMWNGFFLIPIIFISIHVGLGYGFISELIINKKNNFICIRKTGL